MQNVGKLGGERSFELELAASGVTLTVPPDRSIFDVIQDAGISVLGSCHEGICGTCEQIVLEGEVDHRDSVLSESERAANDAMMVCVSRRSSMLLVAAPVPKVFCMPRAVGLWHTRAQLSMLLVPT